MKVKTDVKQVIAVERKSKQTPEKPKQSRCGGKNSYAKFRRNGVLRYRGKRGYMKHPRFWNQFKFNTRLPYA